MWNKFLYPSLFTVQAHNPQLVLQQAHAVCRKLDISHATIQVQDAANPQECPSQSCNYVDPQHSSQAALEAHDSNPFVCVKPSTGV